MDFSYSKLDIIKYLDFWEKNKFVANQSYFNSPQWHRVVLSYYRDTFLTKKINRLIYFEVNFEQDQKVTGFFYVTKAIKGNIITFGHLLGPSDYYDVLYTPKVTLEQLQSVFLQIEQDFNAIGTKFNNIKSSSLTYIAIKDLLGVQLSSLNCVAIALPESYETYFENLSKSVRQNIRTAYNRASKNKVSFQLEVYTKKDSPQINWNHLKELYQQRNQFRKQKMYWKSALYYHLDYLFVKEKDLFDYEATRQTEFTLAVLKINGEVAAYFFGFQTHKNLEINRVVINDHFKFYSPGLILFNEYIRKNIHQLDVIDLTVGDEKYKFDLGGEKHLIFSGNILMNNAVN
jgi:hypothetical protein